MSVTECLEELMAAKQRKDAAVSIELALALSYFIAIKARDEARLQRNVKQLDAELHKIYDALSDVVNDPGFNGVNEATRRSARALVAKWRDRIW